MGESFIVNAKFADQTKITDQRPVAIRWLVRGDGSKVLQFAQAWNRGWSEAGIEWVDVPEIAAPGVNVDRGGEKP